MFFDGNFRGKKPISLGGARSSASTRDKEELLKKTQRERQARETERLRLRSAIRLQAFWRGRQTARTLRALERSAYDASFASATAASGLALNARSLASSIPALLRSLRFFYSRMQDAQRLERLCAFLMTESSEGIPLLVITFADPDVQNWKFAIAKLFEMCLTCWRINRGLKADDPEKVSSVLGVVRLSIEPAAYAKLALVHPTLDTSAMCQSVVVLLVDRGLYPALRDFLISYPPELKYLPSITYVTDLTLRPLALHPDPNCVIKQLAAEILAVPLFPNRIGIEALATFSSTLPFDSVVALLAHDQTLLDRVAEADACGHLLGNLLAFGRGRVGKKGHAAL
ncbi:hypothetical protein BDK51DRAFT_34079, partial [Blyttiomyces helicus]